MTRRETDRPFAPTPSPLIPVQQSVQAPPAPPARPGVPTVTRAMPTPTRPVPVVQASVGDPDTVVRNSDDMDPGSTERYGFETPKCFGNYEDEHPVCEDCPFLEQCIVNNVSQRSSP